MDTLKKILEFGSYAVLLYLGWFMFDTFINSRKGRPRRKGILSRLLGGKK